MVRNVLLLADNDAAFRETWGRVLSDAGYDIRPASNPERVRRLLQETSIDLAILDLRLADDEDEKDLSGLEVATDKAYRHIPKIMLTGFPTSYDNLRKALGPTLDELPPAIAFVDKAEGPTLLQVVVEQSLAQYVRINYDLKFAFPGPQFFHSVVGHIFGDNLSDDELDSKAEELEKLFRRAFYDYTEVELKPVAMTRREQVLVRVLIEQKGKQPPTRLVRCGRRGDIVEERRAYENKNRGEFVREWRVQKEVVKESLNFGIIVYSASGFELERAQWLVDYFKLLTAKEVNSVLDDWFDRAWTSLYSQPCPAEQNKTLNLIYRERLGLTEQGCTEERFRRILRETIEYVQSHHMTRVETEARERRFVLSFSDGSQLSCPHPTLYLYRNAGLFKPPVFCRLSLGCMDGYNILVDQEGEARVAGFSAIGPAPALSDFVALEARVRFEWVHTASLDWSQLREFEALLTTPRFLEESLEMMRGLGDRGLDKALAVIAHLRTLAARVPGADPQEHQLGLLFQAAGILADNASLDRRAHALLAAAMISRGLERWEEFETA